MTRPSADPVAAPDLLDAVTGLARDLRRSFCSLLQDEIDLLTGNVIELDLLCREVTDAAVIVRLAGVSEALDSLRAEKVALAARLGCIHLPDGRA